MSGSSEASKQSHNRPLHFVNTNPSLAGTKDAGKSTRDVKSHLSGHYRRWKKQQTLQAQATQGQHLHSAQGSEASTPAQHHTQELRWPSRPDLPADDSETSSDGGSGQEELILLGDMQGVSEATSLHDFATRGNSDPLSPFQSPIDSNTNIHIQTFHQGTMVMCWTNATDTQRRDFLDHKALMQGILAISKIISATHLQGGRSTPAVLSESRYHYGQLLRLMREHFADPVNIDSNLAIELIHAAMMFSFLAKEYDEFELHLTSLKALIDSLGGLNNLSRAHCSRFLNAERIRALYLLKGPLTPEEIWAPGAWSDQDNFRPYDQLYEQGKIMMSSPNPPLVPSINFSQRVQNLIMDHRSIFAAENVATALYGHRNPDVDTIARWTCLRSHALAIRTGDLVREMTSTIQDKPSLEFNLSICACLAANSMGHIIEYARIPAVGLSYLPFPSLTQNLRDVSRQLHHGAQLMHHDLYLWALFVGACAELTSRTWSHDPTFRGSYWCCVHFGHMVDKLGIQAPGDLTASLRRYLFPPTFESYLRVLVEKRHELLKSAVDSSDSSD